MNLTQLNNELRHAMESSDFIDEARSITEALKEEGAGLESVGVILKFMEDHPNFDFGTPGPLAHFIETFYGHGYEAELFASIARRPTTHTIWLLNRIINGTKEPTWDAVQSIETQALVKGGMSQAAAEATVSKAISILKAAGVKQPTKIPWSDK
jgi:hypothetical protein